MAKKKGKPVRPFPPNLLDNPSTMSQCEKEDLAAKARLAAERKRKKLPKPATGQPSSV
jgi:hypothetical protein